MNPHTHLIPGASPDLLGPARGDLSRLAARGRHLRARAVRRALARLAGALGRTVDRLVAAPLRRWRGARRTYRELAALSDHMLRDIGLSRSELHAVARGIYTPYRGTHGRGGPARPGAARHRAAVAVLPVRRAERAPGEGLRACA